MLVEVVDGRPLLGALFSTDVEAMSRGSAVPTLGAVLPLPFTNVPLAGGEGSDDMATSISAGFDGKFNVLVSRPFKGALEDIS